MTNFSRRLLRSFGVELSSCVRVPFFREPLLYLHIGKTAGSQIDHVISQINSAQSKLWIIKNDHNTTLQSLPKDARYFFGLRNPIARFRWGLYSRKRMGRPRLNNPWSPSEERVFQEFEHANDLAEALFLRDTRGQRTLAAMMTTGHIGNMQIDWFKSAGDIFNLRRPVWIIRQEHLETDISTLLHRIGINESLSLTTDPVLAHFNDYSGIPDLSELAHTNLELWYAADF